MYVCLCHAVSDQEIIAAVESGADDLLAIQERLGAGTGCGSCREMTEQLISQTRGNQAQIGQLAYAIA